MRPERHQCIYIAQLPCYASSQDRRITIIANSSPNLGPSWSVCNRFRAFFLSLWSGVVDRTVPTGTCAHENNQFATNMAGQASRRSSIWTCRCAPSEYYGMFLVTEAALKTN